MEGEKNIPSIQNVIQNTIELESINTWLGDFDSILQDIAIKLKITLNTVELDSIKKQKVIEIYTNLRNYKRAISNVKQQVKLNKDKVEPILKQDVDEVKTYQTALVSFNERTNKIAQKIRVHLGKCENYLGEENQLIP